MSNHHIEVLKLYFNMYICVEVHACEFRYMHVSSGSHKHPMNMLDLMKLDLQVVCCEDLSVCTGNSYAKSVHVHNC